MAEQNGWRPHEAQPKSLLPIPSRQGTLYRGLQEFVGPFGPVVLRRKVKEAIAPFQCLGGTDQFESAERHFFKTSFKNDQCHLHCSRENRLISLQSDVCGLTIRRELQFGVKKSQVKYPIGSGLLR